jgi:hypothetical protein
MDESYYGVLRMRDLRAGRLKRLKNETSVFLPPASWQATGPVSARLRLAHPI